MISDVDAYLLHNNWFETLYNDNIQELLLVSLHSNNCVLYLYLFYCDIYQFSASHSQSWQTQGSIYTEERTHV